MEDPTKKDLLDDVCNSINSLLVASGGMMTAGELKRDYYEVIKKPIPFKELGYSTVDDFLKNIPHVAQTFISGGQLVLKIVINEASSHIIRMVQKQKKSKPKSKAVSLVRGGFAGIAPRAWNTRPSCPILPWNNFSTPKFPWATQPQFQRKTSPRPPLLGVAPRAPLLGTAPRPPLLGVAPGAPLSQTAPLSVRPAMSKNPAVAAPVDFETVKKRIAEIVEGKTEGLSRAQVDSEYQRRFQVSLATDWLNRIIELAKEDEIRCEVHHGSWLILPGKPKPPEVFRPIARTIPESKTWNVLVESVEGVDVYVRIIDEGEEMLAQLLEDLDRYYSENETTLKFVQDPQKEALYVAKIHNDSYNWERVQVVEVSDASLRVLLVDRGEHLDVEKEKLYPILEDYVKLPCQFVQCQLFGLSAVKDVEALLAAITSLCDDVPQYFAEVADRQNLALVLYNEEGLNMNMAILMQAANSVPPPVLPSTGMIQNVNLLHVTPAGDVYVRPCRPITSLVLAMLDVLKWEFSSMESQESLTEVSLFKKYLLQDPVDQKCYRVRVTGKPDSKQHVPVYLMDTGVSELVPLSSLRDVSQVYPALCGIAELALQVRLARVPPSDAMAFTERAAQRLLEMIPKGTSVLMRLTQVDPPLVDLYKHAAGSSELVYVNATLEMDSSLFDPIEVVDVDSVLLAPSKSSVAADFALPQLEDVLPVVISCAINAHDFWLQRRETQLELNALMHTMQGYYNYPEATESKLLNSQAQVGGYYAVYHGATGLWHRAQVMTLQKTSSVVLLIDYGNTEIVVGEKLYRLLPEFCALPAQAVKARLYGVNPVRGDWSVEEKNRFRQLEQKEFFAFVWDVLPQSTLLVELIDTAGEDDVLVSRLLIDEGMALAVQD